MLHTCKSFQALFVGAESPDHHIMCVCGQIRRARFLVRLVQKFAGFYAIRLAEIQGLSN